MHIRGEAAQLTSPVHALRRGTRLPSLQPHMHFQAALCPRGDKGGPLCGFLIEGSGPGRPLGYPCIGGVGVGEDNCVVFGAGGGRRGVIEFHLEDFPESNGCLDTYLFSSHGARSTDFMGVSPRTAPAPWGGGNTLTSPSWRQGRGRPPPLKSLLAPLVLELHSFGASFPQWRYPHGPVYPDRGKISV